MALFQNNLLMGAASQSGSSGFSIDQSIRFNPANSPVMTKTYSGAGDRTAWTFSTWFKLGDCNNMTAGSGLYYVLFACDAGTSDANRGIFSINNDSSASGGMKIQFEGHSTVFLKTNRQLRDPSAWYHITLVWDSDNTYELDRCRLYINGVRETSFATQNNPTSGQEIGINTANAHRLGAGYNISGGSVVYHFDGYIAETVFLDGTAATASSFGEFKEDSDIWVPTDVSGLTFGTNGFWIDGRDSSALGDDEAGSNDYTTSGLVARDQVADSPSNNFCVLNKLIGQTWSSNQTRPAMTTIKNLITRYSSGANGFGVGSMAVPSTGKWYWELYTGPSYPGNEALYVTWVPMDKMADTGTGFSRFSCGLLQRHTTSAYSYWGYAENQSAATGLTPIEQDVTIGVATDFDANTVTLTTDGSSYGSVDFDSTSPSFSFDTYASYTPMIMLANDADGQCTINFGHDSTFNGQISAGGNSDGSGYGDFKYSVPSEHLSLCSKNVGS